MSHIVETSNIPSFVLDPRIGPAQRFGQLCGNNEGNEVWKRGIQWLGLEGQTPQKLLTLDQERAFEYLPHDATIEQFGRHKAHASRAAEATVALIKAINFSRAGSDRCGDAWQQLLLAQRLFKKMAPAAAGEEIDGIAYSDDPVRQPNSLKPLVQKLLSCGPNNVGAWTVAVALERYGLQILPEPAHEVRLPALVIQSGGLGRALRLVFRHYRGATSADKPLLIPDPVPLGCTGMADDFRGSIETAWKYVSSPSGMGGAGGFAPGDLVAWRLLDLDGAAELAGPSLGGAFAVGLLGLSRGLMFDQVPLCAAVDDHGELSAVGIDQKLEAEPFKVGKYRRLILWQPKDGALSLRDRLPELQAIRPPDVISVPNVKRAMEEMTGKVALIRDFLTRLADKGLAKRMLFPPPVWAGQSLRDFCIEPQLLTEAQWVRYRNKAAELGQGSIPHEMELPSEAVMRGELNETPISLGRTLGHEQDTPRNRRVIIRGNPGEGKSTALWLYVGNQVSSLLRQLKSGVLGTDSAEFLVPLVLPLGDGKGKGTDLVALAVDKTLEIACGNGRKAVSPRLRTWVDQKVLRGEYTLALDALDELAPPAGHEGQAWLHEQIQEVPPTVAILLTTRPNTTDVNLGLGQSEIYRMTCFGPKQVARYVRSYFGEQTDKAELLLCQLRQSPGPRQLAQLPLLLAVLCHVHHQNDPNAPLPSTRTELLGTALMHLFERGDQKRVLKHEQGRGGNRSRKPEIQRDPLRTRLKVIILFYVAWAFWNDAPSPMDETELVAKVGSALASVKNTSARDDGTDAVLKRIDPCRLIEELCEDGVFVKMLARGQRHYRFVLRSFQEYLVSGYIARYSDDSTVERLLREKLFRGSNSGIGVSKDALSDYQTRMAWEDIWPLAAGQATHSSYFSRRLMQELWSRPDTNHPSSVYSLLGRAIRERQCADDSSYTAALVRILLNSSRGVGEYERRGCVEALRQIGDADSCQGLISRLCDTTNDRFGWIRQDCAHALGSIGYPEGREILISQLSDPDIIECVSAACIWSLGCIGDDRSRDTLIKHLLDQSAGYRKILLRHKCVEALRNMSDIASRRALISRLRDPSNDIPGHLRVACAHALGEAVDNESRGALIDRLFQIADDTADDEIRFACVRSLVAIGDAASRAAVVMRLKEPANDPHGWVRAMCAEVLGQLGGSDGRSALITRLVEPLNDDNGKIRRSCVEALGMLGDRESLKALAARLCDPADDEGGLIRRSCANVLGPIGSVESRDALRECLDDPTIPDVLRKACHYFVVNS